MKRAAELDAEGAARIASPPRKWRTARTLSVAKNRSATIPRKKGDRTAAIGLTV